MFGLEKKGKLPVQFDLEEDIKKHPEFAQELLHTVEKKIKETKEDLRLEKGSEDLDKTGVILQGYVALQKVLKKAMQEK